MTGPSAAVYVGDSLAATIERTREGSRFRYLPAYLEAAGGDPQPRWLFPCLSVKRRSKHEE